jgi:hypothetical protein
MRLAQKAANSKRPTLVLFTSQTPKSAFAARKVSDRIRPISAGYGTVKIAFLSKLLIHLDGDPDPDVGGPDFARAQVVKSKLGGGKPSFGYRLTSDRSRFEEIDLAAVSAAREEANQKAETERIGKLGEGISALIRKHPGLSGNQIRQRVSAKTSDVIAGLAGQESMQAIRWEPGPRGARLWYPS